MIQSFGDPVTEAIFHGTRSARLNRVPADIRRVVERKLDMLHAAHLLKDLRSPPGNRLGALRGDLAGHHSIRVNQQWRILFRWTEAGPAGVSLVDYH